MKNLIIIIALFIIVFSSCEKGGVSDCFYSTGNITKEVRSVERFNSILLKDNVNLILNKSVSNRITVETGSNLLKGILTEVSEDGVLEISNINQCNWIRSFDSPIVVYLDYVDIDTIEYRSIGDITSVDTVITDTLWLKVMEGAGMIKMNLNVDRMYCGLHYGTSDIVLSGQCGLSYVYSASFGLIDLVNLETGFVYVNNRSSNDIYLNAKTHLGASIENIGNIYYKGNPGSVTFEKIGDGELIKLPD